MPRIFQASCFFFVFAIPLVALGCSGGNSGVHEIPSELLGYSNTASPRYSYDPYEWYSHAHTYRMTNGDRFILIGGDLEPRQLLRQVDHAGGFRIYMGPSRDGEGIVRLAQYRSSLAGSGRTGLLPFSEQPDLYLDPDLFESANARLRWALEDSVDLLNDALPPEYQMRWKGSRDPVTFQNGEIVVDLVTRQEIGRVCGSTTAVACATSWLSGTRTTRAKLFIPDDFDTSQYTLPRKVIVHELLHALGISGHVNSVQFPDSVMGTSGDHFPNPGHIIGRTDREILQVMYMSKLPAIYNSWGRWTDVAYHVMAESEDKVMRFGVALFNGLPQPWVRGEMPRTTLASNSRLSGTATWNGFLLGFSGPSAIAGDAELQVRLSTLSDASNEQDLRFRDIYFVNRWEETDRWFPTRNIDYKVNVSGNWFQNVRGTGYEQGFVQGAFLGAGHEHMGGTAKRTDMVAAFGGSR